MGEQDYRIDKKTDAAGENARDSSALHERPSSTATGEHKPKPETAERAETDELLDDRFQATDN